MIEWKRFEDEVPVEPRGVVTGGYDDCGDWCINAWSFARCSNGDFWSEVVGCSVRFAATDASLFWLNAVEDKYTHWAYIDPPHVVGGGL